ncbi:hypothetical protein [Bacillus mobilis]|uniref:hypothetical protein n=1 Tax=Bacillus mobilis TaxID=2026190 RepID=UPI003CF01634
MQDDELVLEGVPLQHNLHREIDTVIHDEKRASSPSGELAQNRKDFIDKLFGIAL